MSADCIIQAFGGCSCPPDLCAERPVTPAPVTFVSWRMQALTCLAFGLVTAIVSAAWMGISLDSNVRKPIMTINGHINRESVMPTISVAEAKAGFASLVDEAANGEFVTITRHGKPAAVLVSVEAAEAAKKALNKPRPNFGDFLLSFPGGVELKRNPSKMRGVDL
ncbi:type II toxin-antitoxin system antitoxin Phd/YefM family protein [Rhizobium phaseoli]|nr:type II toxin-antitoxin system antitoxin Phd/YefM family protein [Rhizobium phaseoli]ANL71114.1 type II toxin-antitoxin system antitoxin Phd/YefM family protein [Rhizobium phaseoli]